jgi:hypothetical protein
MGTYKEIRGTHIVSVTSDPPSPVNGQVWYNSTDKVVKGFTSNPAGTWATITAINTARGAGQLGGTATSAWFVGGEINPPHPSPGSNWSTKNELWNGTSWTESNDLTRPGFYSGMGSRGVPNNTTGLVFGGHQGTDPATQYAQTEEWNGSSWTEVGDLNTGRRGGGGAGTSAEACLCFGAAYGNPFVGQDLNESWNGSSWTEVLRAMVELLLVVLRLHFMQDPVQLLELKHGMELRGQKQLIILTLVKMVDQEW